MTSLRHNQSTVAGPDSPRDDYLDAARDCILDVGWRRTTLTEVARRAGVSRMTIYRTWADMPQLLGDLMTREWTGVVATQVGDDATTQDASTAASTLDRLVRDVVATARALRHNELFVRIVELDPELVLPYLLSRRGRSQDLIIDVVAGVIREGQAAGEIRDGDPVTMARTVVLALHGFVLSAHTMVDEAVTAEALDAELALLLTRALAP